MSKIVIVGAGASGLACAICAKRNSNEVIVIEKNSTCGKKILASGNGKCNYFNDDFNIDHYHSQDKELLNKIITSESKQKILDFFSSIGIIPKIKNGYYYPNSDQSISILNSLFTEAKKLGVIFYTDSEVLKITKHKQQFTIITKDKNFIADKIVISTGSKAGIAKNYNGYKLAISFNHTLINVLPALVQLRTNASFLKSWAGVRVDAKIKLYENNKFIKEEVGQLQLTDYGISGICVFNLSGLVAKSLENKNTVKIVIDFLPIVKVNSLKEFVAWLDERNKLLSKRNLVEFLEGIINYKLIQIFIKNLYLLKQASWNDLSYQQKLDFAKQIKEFNLIIKSTNSYEKAQVCSGGIKLSEINLKTFESKLEPGVYFTGEIIDVDGDCGGYNLAWAWISGIRCGENL